MARPHAQAQADQAQALAHAGHVDEACALAMEALTIGQRYGFERIVRQIHGIRAELPRDSRVAAALDDALAEHDA